MEQLLAFCYGILDVFRFEKGVKACGQLGIWTPKQDAQNQIAQQISVQNKINEWKQTYGDQSSNMLLLLCSCIKYN